MNQSPLDELRATSNSRYLWDMLNVTTINDAKANLKDNKIATVLFFLELQDKDIAFVRDLLVEIDDVLKRPGEKEEFLSSVKRL
ncbi:hypothetical protein Tco_0852749 [Tanacetum coccineum]